ncbi:TPM domain-containing protein [Oxalobacter vibrioformis]|uniref:TPM domain-containing protein n=1 Tax=Oxalobacter vibrioformis TaxID=933080 RepID=A0A9E9LX57_9BURK|nr:TPM domain-containing protein [Oxalobacter vibrioformis]NLC24139.1 TPM domain-containing protein [Oxalobacter sp.]WAW09235.1 TPM domain-containing protein [Oxalobacter vibrioformis]
MSRFFRHLFTTRTAASRVFPATTLKAIESCITEGEKTHRAELRVIIEPALSMDAIRAKTAPRERALELFGRYGIWDTEENCGVLVYINLADRQVEIVADRGVAPKVDQKEWDTICLTMTEGFSQGRFQQSTLDALTSINQLLKQHFPLNGPRENQLPDEPILL